MPVIKAKLPDKCLWIPREGTDRYPFCWESKDSHRLQVRSDFEFDWHQKQVIAIQENRGRNRNAQTITRIDLRVVSSWNGNPLPCIIDYQIVSGICYSLEPTHRFYAIAVPNRNNLSIALSIIEKPAANRRGV